MTDRRPIAAAPTATSHTRRRFALIGRSHAFDRRIEAARGDLADVRLADRIFAPHYAAAIQRSALHRAPMLAAHGGSPTSEVLRGETFDVLELSHGYAWGVGIDGAVGFVAIDALGAPYPVTHIVCGVGADLPVGSRLSAEEAASADAAMIRPLDSPIRDFVAAAEMLVGVPAVAGGRSGAGLDGAGLVALTLSLAGLRAPRFADLQAEQLGHAVATDAPLLRGDLVFRGEDTAIVADADSVIGIADGAVARQAAMAFVGDGDAVVRRRLP